LLRIIALLAEAALDMRRQADLSATIGQRALMAIAVNARQRH
jgi:DNA polymerase-3 subunit delta